MVVRVLTVPLLFGTLQPYMARRLAPTVAVLVLLLRVILVDQAAGLETMAPLAPRHKPVAATSTSVALL